MIYTLANRNHHTHNNKKKIVLKKFIRSQSVTCMNIERSKKNRMKLKWKVERDAESGVLGRPIRVKNE